MSRRPSPKANELSEERAAEIARDARVPAPTPWGSLPYPPACICGLRGAGMPLGTGHQFNPEKTQKCQRHDTTETTT